MALEPRDPAVESVASCVMACHGSPAQWVLPSPGTEARHLKAAGFSPPKLQREEIEPGTVTVKAMIKLLCLDLGLIPMWLRPTAET